ncbi:NlpC/P60 family protein [Streptomyces sp. NBC_01565]|uniref:NlpC/P60 family protein n=1 Tax=unclassified Streptomyces TaxID=2593676 RepID=UPI0022515EC4|nr:NlpC/P60 family protein [Streptomyces sp. NBC_01565]MCX4545552.1 NlpC/P60 family protein [Streptomyces sp. NBC_01565]
MPRRSGLIGALIALFALLLGSSGATAAPAAADACRVLAPGASASAESAVAAACEQVAAGVWYSWGGGHGPQPGASYGQVDPSDPASEHDPERLGFDCSGLVRYAYARAAGSDILSGVADTQYYTHRAAERFTADQGLSPLLPGDLLAWGTPQHLHHIAIYLGAGKMAEAKQSGTKLMVSDVRLNGDYHGAVRVNTGAVTGHVFQTWGAGVWTKAAPSVSAARVYAFPGPTTIRVECQKHAEKVTADGYTNDAWSYLPDYKAWMTNIYIKGPAWLEPVPTCAF